jgi:hypothetical protein
VARGIVTVAHIPTTSMVADVLTKPLAKVKFYRFINIILGMAKMETDCLSEVKPEDDPDGRRQNAAKTHSRQQHGRDALRTGARLATASRTGGRKVGTQVRVLRTGPVGTSDPFPGGDMLKLDGLVPGERPQAAADAQGQRQHDRDGLQIEADKAAVSFTDGRRAAARSRVPRTGPAGRPASNLPPSGDRLGSEQGELDSRDRALKQWPPQEQEAGGDATRAHNITHTSRTHKGCSKTFFRAPLVRGEVLERNSPVKGFSQKPKYLRKSSGIFPKFYRLRRTGFSGLWIFTNTLLISPKPCTWSILIQKFASNW